MTDGVRSLPIKRFSRKIGSEMVLYGSRWTGWSGSLVVDPTWVGENRKDRHKFTEKHGCFFLSLRHTHTHECSRFQIPKNQWWNVVNQFPEVSTNGFNMFQAIWVNVRFNLRTTPWRSGLAKLPRRPSLGKRQFAQNFDPFWLAGKIPCSNDLISRIFPSHDGS